ncbi:MAG TPA: type II toxin-antitoxin system RelE/ParE family toxin [Steroidobacteraceae bacterium]|nr:type II toxin-antitoxin system RelE/ParE family toxin [Steroidobacteraceae bacterium]
MANLPVRLHPFAADEVQAARIWYFERNPEVSEGFLSDVDAAILAIRVAPQRWPRIHGKYRRYIMRDFPFSVVYLSLSDSIEVIAVAHHRRRPGYWLAR